MSIIFMLLLGCADTTKVEEKLSAIETKLSNLETKLAEKPKERVIVDYKVVVYKMRFNDPSPFTKLDNRVKKAMGEGWEPLGAAGKEDYSLYQAMVKYGTKE